MARDPIVAEAKSTARVRRGSCNCEDARDTACIFMQLTRQIKSTSSYSTRGGDAATSSSSPCVVGRILAGYRCVFMCVTPVTSMRFTLPAWQASTRKIQDKSRPPPILRRIFPRRNYVALNSSASPAPFDGSRYPADSPPAFHPF